MNDLPKRLLSSGVEGVQGRGDARGSDEGGKLEVRMDRWGLGLLRLGEEGEGDVVVDGLDLDLIREYHLRPGVGLARLLGVLGLLVRLGGMFPVMRVIPRFGLI